MVSKNFGKNQVKLYLFAFFGQGYMLDHITVISDESHKTCTFESHAVICIRYHFLLNDTLC